MLTIEFCDEGGCLRLHLTPPPFSPHPSSPMLLKCTVAVELTGFRGQFEIVLSQVALERLRDVLDWLLQTVAYQAGRPQEDLTWETVSFHIDDELSLDFTLPKLGPIGLSVAIKRWAGPSVVQLGFQMEPDPSDLPRAVQVVRAALDLFPPTT